MARTTVAMIGRQIERKLDGLAGGASTLSLSDATTDALMTTAKDLKDAANALSRSLEGGLKIDFSAKDLKVEVRQVTAFSVTDRAYFMTMVDLINHMGDGVAEADTIYDLAETLKAPPEELSPFFKDDLEAIKSWACQITPGKLVEEGKDQNGNTLWKVAESPTWKVLRQDGTKLCEMVLSGA